MRSENEFFFSEEVFVIEELDFVEEELLITLEEVGDGIPNLRHEKFVPGSLSVLFVSLVLLPLPRLIALVDALEAGILMVSDEPLALVVLALITELLLADLTHYCPRPPFTFITKFVHVVALSRLISLNEVIVHFLVVFFSMEPLPGSVVLVVILFKLFQFFVDRTALSISGNVSPRVSDGSFEPVTNSPVENGGLRGFLVKLFIIEFFIKKVFADVFFIFFSLLLINLEAFLLDFRFVFVILEEVVVVPSDDGRTSASSSSVGVPA